MVTFMEEAFTFQNYNIQNKGELIHEKNSVK